MSVQQLRDLLISNISSSEDKQDTQAVIAETISEYLKDNLVLYGVYSGVIPAVPPIPDPLSGLTFIFNVGTLNIDSDSLLTSARTGGFSAWQTSLGMEITKLTFIGQGKLGTTANLTVPAMPKILTLLLNIGVNEQDTFEMAMGRIATAIVTSLPSAILSLPVTACTSINGGKGTITFGGITL